MTVVEVVEAASPVVAEEEVSTTARCSAGEGHRSPIPR